MKRMGKEGMMDRAEASEPKSGARAPAASREPKSDHVGNEKRADMKGALMGQPTDGNPLRGAMKELSRQHPIKHDDLGPHHHTSHHERHMPLHGMKPGR